MLVVGILIGAVAGVVSAKKVKMTDMPQLVSVFNTVGGGAAALVALNDILTKEGTPGHRGAHHRWSRYSHRFCDLHRLAHRCRQAAGYQVGQEAEPAGQGRMEHSVRRAVRRLAGHAVRPAEQRLLWSILTTVFALCYGLVFVIPIGGADMPVVISVLNACDRYGCGYVRSGD